MPLGTTTTLLQFCLESKIRHAIIMRKKGLLRNGFALNPKSGMLSLPAALLPVLLVLP